LSCGKLSGGRYRSYSSKFPIRSYLLFVNFYCTSYIKLFHNPWREADGNEISETAQGMDR
ncbi:hypothetical protein, partial [Paenibacillus phytohabitans]|uniref:hypothetical protein n=1 Tax=Paenibacillus phytohabitans TaxID=2654978 RepID=UPI00300A543C